MPTTPTTRRLGDSALEASVVGLGCNNFGRRLDLDATAAVLDAALRAGITFLDTADVYGDGESERLMGEALAGRRGECVLATKFGLEMRGASGVPDVPRGSREYVRWAIEGSLKRLRVERIDLYQYHKPDGVTPLEETIEALDTLVRSGKVRYVGCSNYAAWQLMKALCTSERLRLERFVSQQIHYTLQAREAEYELIPAGLDQGVGVLVWSPLAGGLLTGKYRRGQQGPDGARQLTTWDEPPVHDPDTLYDIVDVLVEIAEARGASAAQVALAWLLGRPGVCSVIVGARTEEQLADNLRAAELELSEEERARLDEVSEPPLLYPHWHQAKTASDRLGEPERSLLGPRAR
jgi:aryl-alcohol dehydrogenase-like predicted oxidoreductase